MAKVKNHIIEDKSDYLKIAINIGICIFCIFMIGRVGILGNYLGLFLSFLVGDFSTLLLCIILICTIVNIVFKKSIDVHHIFFIGAIFIFLGLLMLSHLGLYNSLTMDNKNILSKTLKLYKNYLNTYDINYTCGGGMIGASLLQLVCLLTGQIGGAIVGVGLILIGISYFTNVKLFSIFGDGKLRFVFRNTLSGINKYFKNIHFPILNKKETTTFSINDLSDIEDKGNFFLQNEINKEKYDEFNEYLKQNYIQGLLDGYYTSYGSSRFILRYSKVNDIETKRFNSWFGEQTIMFKYKNDFYIDYPNQFRKLLTLKNMLVDNTKYNIPLIKDINGKNVNISIINGKKITIIGDENSGVKTTIKSLIASLLIKGVKPEDLILYDLKKEYSGNDNSNIVYVNNIDDSIKCLDELFCEFERRMEVLKYFNLDNIEELNNHIKKTGLNVECLNPIVHIFNFNLNQISDTLLNKLVYAIRLADKVGISIIVCVRNINELTKLELNKMDIMCLNISDISISIKMFGSEIASKLSKKGDCLLRLDGKIYHGQIPYISNSDFERICFKNSHA